MESVHSEPPERSQAWVSKSLGITVEESGVGAWVFRGLVRKDLCRLRRRNGRYNAAIEPLRDAALSPVKRPASQPVRVLIADDQTLFRTGLARMLAADPRLEVVGQAKDGVDAIDQAL